MLGSWSFPLVTNYAPDGIDIRKFLVNIQNRVVYIMIVSHIIMDRAENGEYCNVVDRADIENTAVQHAENEK